MSTANENAIGLAMRSDFLSYMKTELNDSGIHLIGPGFTSLSESKNPKEYTRHYIHENSDTTDTVGYAPSISYTTDAQTEDPCCLEVMAIADRELVGKAARRIIYNVNTFEKGSTTGKVKAFKRTYSVVPDNKGDGTDALVYSGSFKAVGDVEIVDWDTITNQPATTDV